MRWKTFLARVAENPPAALALAGVLLYVVLRLPYASYYGAFDVGPDEIGLNYVETLARSTGGLIVVALIVGAIAAFGMFVFTVLRLYVRIVRANISVRGFPKGNASELDDTEYAKLRAATTSLIKHVVKGDLAGVDALVARQDEHRALLRTTTRTPEQQVCLDSFGTRQAMFALFRLVRGEAWRLAARAATWCAVLASIACVVVLPFVARSDADAVRRCGEPRLGRYGLFAVRGEAAELFTSDGKGTLTRTLPGRRLMYLGSGEDRAVMFDCDTKRTVRLPAADLVIETLDIPYETD